MMTSASFRSSSSKTGSSVEQQQQKVNGQQGGGGDGAGQASSSRHKSGGDGSPVKKPRTTVAEKLKGKSKWEMPPGFDEIGQDTGAGEEREQARDRVEGHGQAHGLERRAEEAGGSDSRGHFRGAREGRGRGGRRGGKRAGERPDGPGPIPDRWLQYSAIGRPMEGSRFLAFKTPLRPAFFQLAEFQGGDRQQHFQVESVLQHAAQLKRQLGLVIDLTNTDRYYDSQLWQSHQVQYQKIRCPGHEVNADEQLYVKFHQAVHAFLTQNADNDKLVGVHCTHGLNRTGYLICRYLIEQNGWAAQAAIDAFNSARGYQMERLAYIQSLHELDGKMAGMSLGGEGQEEKGEEEDGDGDHRRGQT